MKIFVVLAPSLLLLIDGSWGQNCKADFIGPAFEDLFSSDVNNVYDMITVERQGKSGTSEDFDPLFENVPQEALAKPTFKSFIELVQDSIKGHPINMTKKNKFLSEVNKTAVMEKLTKYLPKNEIKAGLHDTLDAIWFTVYKRGSIQNSSGFRHVFLGEPAERKIGGLHNWITYYMNEKKKGDVEYKGWLKWKDLEKEDRKANVIVITFSWNNTSKPRGSMFVGTSPEFDMAVYTLCFFNCKDEKCPVKVGNATFNINTFSKNFVGTAYPTDL